MIKEEILKDLELAREIISKKEGTVVIIKYGKIWKKKKEEGIRPLMEAIDEMGEDVVDSIIGVSILGKASSLVCRNSKVAAVYSPQGTKTGIALLILGSIPCQVDQMIPCVQNPDLFEDLVKEIDSPEEACKILKNKIFGEKQIIVK